MKHELDNEALHAALAVVTQERDDWERACHNREDDLRSARHEAERYAAEAAAAMAVVEAALAWLERRPAARPWHEHECRLAHAVRDFEACKNSASSSADPMPAPTDFPNRLCHELAIEAERSEGVVTCAIGAMLDAVTRAAKGGSHGE